MSKIKAIDNLKVLLVGFLLSFGASIAFSFYSFAVPVLVELPEDYTFSFTPVSVGASIDNPWYRYTAGASGSVTQTYISRPDSSFGYRTANISAGFPVQSFQSVYKVTINNKYWAYKVVPTPPLTIDNIQLDGNVTGFILSAVGNVYYYKDYTNKCIYFFSTEPIDYTASQNDSIRAGVRFYPVNVTASISPAFVAYFDFGDSPFYAPPVIPPTYEEIMEDFMDKINSGINKLSSILRNMQGGFQASLDWLTYNVTNNESGLSVGSTKTLSIDSVDEEGEAETISKSFVYPSYIQYDLNIQDEHVNFTQSDKAGTFLGIIHRKLNEMLDYFRLQFELFFQWYYPLKDSMPQYWQVFNTDTNSSEMVNPAGVTYYITWYLGKLYQHLDADIDSILEGPVSETKQAISHLESSEDNLKNEVIPNLQSFRFENLDFNNHTFNALSWVRNILQQIFVALSHYNKPIMISLMLALAMQFIGYFKYK